MGKQTKDGVSVIDVVNNFEDEPMCQMKKITNCLWVLLPLLFLACSDDGNEPDGSVLFTYSSDQAPGFNVALFLTDDDGNIIDSDRAIGTTEVVLSGSPEMTSHSLTEVLIFESPISGQLSRLTIASYFGTTQNSRESFVPTTNQQPIGTVTLNISPDINQAFLRTTSVAGFGGSPQAYSILENDVIYMALKPQGTESPKYLIIKDPQPGDVRDIDLEDFTDMDVVAIEGLSGVNFINGQENDVADPSVFVDVGFINSNSLLSTSSPLFFPGDAFGRYTTSLSAAPIDNMRFTNLFYGAIPTQLDPIVVNSVDVADIIDNYYVNIDADYNIAFTTWTGVASDVQLTWNLYGPKDYQYNLSQIIDAIETLYPQVDLTVLNRQNLNISNNLGLTYDQVIGTVINNSPITDLPITEQRSMNMF